VIADNGIIRVLYYTGRFEKRVRALVPNIYEANKGRRRIDRVAAAVAAHIRRRAPAALVGETVVATSPTPPSIFCKPIDRVETTVVHVVVVVVVGCLQACSRRVRPISLTLTRSSCRPAKFTARVHRHNIFLLLLFFFFIKSVGRLSLPTLTPCRWPQSQSRWLEWEIIDKMTEKSIWYTVIIYRYSHYKRISRAK